MTRISLSIIIATSDKSTNASDAAYLNELGNTIFEKQKSKEGGTRKQESKHAIMQLTQA